MRKSRLLASLLCAALMVGVLTVPAYARAALREQKRAYMRKRRGW